MDLKGLSKLDKIYPLTIQKFNSFLPTSESADPINRINTLIQYLNQMGKLTNDVVADWNKVMQWVMGDGLTDSMKENIYTLIQEGKFNELIQTLSNEFNSQIESELNEFKTNVSTELTNVSESLDEVTVLAQEQVDLFSKNQAARQTDFANLNNEFKKKSLLRDNRKGLEIFKKPTFFTPNLPIKIFKDNGNFVTDFNVSTFKNNSTNIWYVSTTGNNNNDGKTSATAFLTLEKAHSIAVDGDTIQILSGMYSSTHLRTDTWTKSLNIIGSGNVLITSGDTVLTYTKTDGYTNVYQTTRANARGVFYLFGTNKENFYEFTNVNSIAECDALAGSWYQEGSILYVHALDHLIPDNNVTHAVCARPIFRFMATTGNIKVYLEGITLLGGNCNIGISNSVTYKEPEIYAKNCRFMHSYYYDSVFTGHGITVKGAKYAFFQNCEVGGNADDGFNYHAQNGTLTQFIEVNCKGYRNGDKTSNSNDSYQGSTSHDGCKGISINCNYYNNRGQNIADVNEGTQRLVLGGNFFDSEAIKGDIYFGSEVDVTTKSSGAIIHVEGSYMMGSKYSMIAVSGTTIYEKDNIYEGQLSGGGTITHL